MSAEDISQYTGMFLVNERRPKRSLSLFFDKTESGTKGLCILRKKPEDVIMRERLKKVECHYLLLRDEKDSIRPSNLQKIDEIVSSFFERNKGGIVLLDGFEMLTLFNDYDKVAGLLDRLRTLADSSNGAVVIPVDRRAIYREDFEKISKSFRVVELDRAEKF